LQKYGENMIYELRIIGSADEINLEQDQDLTLRRNGVVVSTLTTFRVAEPKHRYKTLRELVLEYGDDVIIDNIDDTPCISIKNANIPISVLGQHTTTVYSDTIPWIKIFITEDWQ